MLSKESRDFPSRGLFLQPHIKKKVYRFELDPSDPSKFVCLFCVPKLRLERWHDPQVEPTIENLDGTDGTIKGKKDP